MIKRREKIIVKSLQNETEDKMTFERKLNQQIMEKNAY